MTIIFGDTLQAFVDYESFTNCTGTPGLKALGRFLKMILSFYFFFYKFFFEYIFKMTLLEPSFVQTVIHPLNIDFFLSRLVLLLFSVEDGPFFTFYVLVLTFTLESSFEFISFHFIA